MPAASRATTADPASATATDTAHRLIAATSAGQVHSGHVRDAIDQAPSADRQRLAEEVAAKAASPKPSSRSANTYWPASRP